MALQLSYDDDFGNTNASAYHRVTTLLLYVAQERVKIEVSTYKDSAARSAGKEPLRRVYHAAQGADFTTYFDDAVLDTENYNPLERAYEYLKTLDEWDGASDV